MIDSLKKITAVEKKTAQQIAEAGKESAAIIENAEKEARETVRKAVEQARAEAEEAMRKAASDANTEAEKIIREGENAAKTVKAEAGGRIAAATRIILRQVTGEDPDE